MPDSLFPNDIHRPRYHFLPPRNWMNDPNGLAHINGVYHLFYQHNPYGALWGSMSWGHAVSKDLVHWEHLPLAMTPDPDGVDRDGCYSGTLVVHEGVPTIVYTGVRKPDELACLAMGVGERLEQWTKYEGNPVIPGTPENEETTIYRDHTLWREDDAWMMGVGSGLEGRGGAVLLYRSHDLKSWDYLHPLAVEDELTVSEGGPISLGWECPDFFFLDEEPVLVACDWDGDAISVSYWTGRYEEQRFHAAHHGLVDHGRCFYAPQSFLDEAGRRIMFGWLRELRDDQHLLDAGWAGAMSLPRQATRGDDGRIAFRPVEEVAMLRGAHLQTSLRHGEVALGRIRGESCELRLRVDQAADHSIGLEVLRSADGGSHAVVRWDPDLGTLSLDTRQANPNIPGEVSAMTIPTTGELELRVFVDRSVIEIYTGNGESLSGRAYAGSPFQTGVSVINPGGAEGTLDIWDMTDVMP